MLASMLKNFFFNFINSLAKDIAFLPHKHFQLTLIFVGMDRAYQSGAYYSVCSKVTKTILITTLLIMTILITLDMGDIICDAITYN